jgi:hypothetical protein
MSAYELTRHIPGSAITAVVAALAGICCPIPLFVDFYNVPAGTMCRPMGLAMAIFSSGIACPILTLIPASLALFCGRLSRYVAVVAIITSLMPIPLYFWLFHWIVNAHHLVLEP